MSDEFAVEKTSKIYDDKEVILSYQIFIEGIPKYQFSEDEFLQFVGVMNKAVEGKEVKDGKE